ncbi:unnamed protein product [Rhizophagus irregularis]|nr:unnamed protein product [Rhizophagus irregularis]
MEHIKKANIFRNRDPVERAAIQKFLAILKSKKLKETELLSNQQALFQQFKLNHGLFLNGCRIEPSKQAVLIEGDKWNINLYEGQPFVYTSVNDHTSHVNLLSFNSDDDDVELDESLQPSDLCINFPVIEITYTADLSKSFSNFINDDEGKLYGHLLPRKILIGGKLFIRDLKSATCTQIEIFSSYLNWAYDLTKSKKEIPFDNLSALNFFPKILTLDGTNLDTHEKLSDWMNNLYQNDTVEIISYNNLVPISQLKFDKISLVDEIQPGVANFKEKLTLENWVKNSKYARWVEEFQLRGLIINQNLELRTSKENAIDLINIPNVESSDKFYLRIMKPTTILEEVLIHNNIFLANSDEDISSFPFIKISDGLSHEDYAHFLVKCEQYEVLLTMDNIKPSEKFKQAVEKALENMKPLIRLQEVFDEYGHLIPLNIVLGKSLKNTIENSHYISTKINLEPPVFESLKSHLADFSIPCLLTPKGDDIIEENGLSEWVQNMNNDLEIIEFNNIIPLYDILEVDQKKKIDIILNKENNFKIIMTGSIDLKDTNITKQIIVSIEPSLENKNYEVFGSIISKSNSRLKDIFVTFGSYEINKFTATISTSKNTSINIKECYIIWMMIGNPSKLSVFSPNNRKAQVDCIKESIKLQRNNSSYSIKTSHQLSQGYDISFNCFKPINIELTGWSKNCVYLNITNTMMNNRNVKPDIDNVEIAICVLNSGHEKSKIDISGKRYSMGYILTEKNYLDSISNAQKYLRNTYPTKKEREKVTRLIINKKKLEYHLDLSDFVNLEKLNCSENELTSLDISKNKQLTEIDCSQNKLISLDLSNCLNIKLVTANCNQLNELKLPVSNDLKLEYLNLLDNSYSQNLDCFNQLFNLKELLIGNIDGDRIQLGIYNQFHGSLKPLKNLIKLESLSINNTDIEFGLEFLPDSIKNFRCLADQRTEAKVKKIYEQLEEYTLSPIEAFQGKYNLKAWRKNWKLVKEKEALQNQFKQVEELTSSAKLKEFEKEESSLIAEEEDLIEKNKLLEQERKNLEQETDDLKQLVKELNAKLEQKEVDYQQAKQQLEEKEEMLKSFTEEKLENFTAEKLMVKEELNKEIKVLKYELLIKERDTEQSKKHLEEMNKELKIKEEECDILRNKLDNIKSSLSEIKNKKEKLNDLKKKLEYKKNFSKSGTSGLRKQMNDLKREIHSLQSQAIKAREIENELEEVKRNKNRLQNEKVQQQSIVEYLQKEQTILRDNIKNLDTKLSDKVGFINNLEQQSSQQIEELQSKLDEEIRKYRISQEINTSLNDELKNKEKIIKESQNKLNEETRKYQDSLDKLKNKEELNKELESKLDEEIRTYQFSQEIITFLNDELKNKEKIIEESQNKLNDETRKYQDSLDKLKNKEELNKELESKLDEEIRKYQFSQEIITSLSDELKNKEKIIKESQNKLNDETRKYQDSLDKLKNKEELNKELESKLDEGIGKYQVSQEIITSLNSELKNKEKIIEKSQNKLNEEIIKYQDSLDKLKNNEEFIKELQIRLDEEVKKDQAFQKIITSLNSELKNKEKIIKESQNKLNEEIEIITSFNSELKNKENIIEELLFRNF